MVWVLPRTNRICIPLGNETEKSRLCHIRDPPADKQRHFSNYNGISWRGSTVGVQYMLPHNFPLGVQRQDMQPPLGSYVSQS